jgi:hypothetical protein
MAIAAILGAVLVAGGLATAAFRRKDHLPTAVLCVGAGAAAVLASASVLKHYDSHYTAAVSPTLPACLVAGYLLTNAWNLRVRAAWAAISFAAIVLMTPRVASGIADHLNSKIDINAQAMADLQDIEKLPIDVSSSIAFTYSAPFGYFGEGFVIYLASVPRLTAEYHRERPRMFSANAPDSPPRNVGAIVLHKVYFPTAESIKASSNLVSFGADSAVWRDGDRLVDLRTVFVLLRGDGTKPAP